MTPSTLRLKQLAEVELPQSHLYTFIEFRSPYGEDAAAYLSAANPEAVLGLIARIENLEAALQFYADPRTYEGGHNDDVGSTGIDIDYRGNTAREALKEEET